MELSIDTSQRNKITVGLNGEVFEDKATQDASQRLLPFILYLVKKKGKELKDIKKITVNCGPGSFTGLRVGVSVAQTLGWSLKVPVNGLMMEGDNFPRIKYR